MKKSSALVEFIDVTNEVCEEFYPKPAKLSIPDWYKTSLSYRNNKKEVYLDDRGYTSSTIRKCMPVYDAITAGYIIFSQFDLEISGSKFNKKYKWSFPEAITSHSRWQLGNFPDVKDDENIPKWANPWAIRTPRGYSCMFINPMNRAKSPLKFFEGVVDTDKYTAPVNFPFFLQDENWEGILSAGTPLIQVIPFKRESYHHQISLQSSLKINFMQKAGSLVDAFFFNGYKNNFWSRKEYN